MNPTKLLCSAAFIAAVSLSNVAEVAAKADKEKCYGVSLAGQNDCSNLAGTHSCAGQSTLDNDIGEWKTVAKGTCLELGGLLKDEALKQYNEALKQNNKASMPKS